MPLSRRLIDYAAALLGGSRLMAVCLLVLAAAFFCMVFVRPVASSLISWHRTSALVAERRAEVSALRRRHAQLVEEHRYARTDAFIEERARRYGLIRPGEKQFIVREYAEEEAGALRQRAH